MDKKWRQGNMSDAIVTDFKDGEPMYEESILEAYGGRLVCESVCREDEKQLIIHAPDLFNMCRKTHDFMIHMTGSQASLEGLSEIVAEQADLLRKIHPFDKIQYTGGENPVKEPKMSIENLKRFLKSAIKKLYSFKDNLKKEQ